MNFRLRIPGKLSCLLLMFLLAGTALADGGKRSAAREVDLRQFDFRDGDIVFQHLPGDLGSVICEVTNSPLSHCGLIVHRRGEPQVIEAIGPVRYLPLQKWLQQGDRNQFVQMRLKTSSNEETAKALQAAHEFLGRPYDLQYELDDKKIYCSELVYKAYLRGAGREIGKKEKLRELNWRPNEAFIRVLAGGDLPLDREMVTPASVAASPQLKLVYSTFPARKDEPLYDQRTLAGKWSGEYTIRDLTPVTAKVEFDSRGAFSSGAIQLPDGTHVVMTDVQVAPFKAQREFQARLRDARGISGDVQARIRDEGRRIIGTWKDDRGYLGVFSFEKQAAETDRLP